MKRAVLEFTVGAAVCLAVVMGTRELRNHEVSEPSSLPDNTPVFVHEKDHAMNAAMAKARASVSEFTDALKNPLIDQRFSGLKFRIVEGKSVEFVWTSNVTFDGKVFHAVLDHTPTVVHSAREGQVFLVAPNEIADWIYQRDGKMMGAYTFKVLREKMTPEQRSSFDRQGLGSEDDHSNASPSH